MRLSKYGGGWVPGVWDWWGVGTGHVGLVEGAWVPGVWDWWRVGTGRVGLSKYVEGHVRLSKYSGGWVLGVWDSASTVHGGWAPGMYCFFKRWDDI